MPSDVYQVAVLNAKGRYEVFEARTGHDTGVGEIVHLHTGRQDELRLLAESVEIASARFGVSPASYVKLLAAVVARRGDDITDVNPLSPQAVTR